MEDSFDIYADLDNLDVDQVNSDSETEEKYKKQCEDHCKTLEAELAELRAQVQNLMRINNNVEHNFSSLLKTAKAEISRKDRQITELRSKVDTLTFRRDQRHRGRVQNYLPVSNTNSFSVKNHREITDNKQDAHIPSLLNLPCSEVNQPQVEEYTVYNNSNDSYVACSKQSYLQRPSSDESEDEAKTDGAEFKKTLYGERLRNRLLEEKEAERRQKEERERGTQNQNAVEEPKIKVEDSQPEKASLNTSSDKENKVKTNKLSQVTHTEIDPRIALHSLDKPINHSGDEVKVEEKLKCLSEGSQDAVKTEDQDTCSSNGKHYPHDKNENLQLHSLQENVKDECSAMNSHVVSDHNYNRDLAGQNSDKDEYVPLPLRNLKGQDHLHYNGQSRYNNFERSNDNGRRTRRDEYDDRHRRHDHPRSSSDYRARQVGRSRSKHWREENDRSRGRSRSKYRMRENDRYRTDRSRSRQSREDSNHHSKERGRGRYRTDENDPRGRSKSRHQREDMNRPRRRSRSKHQTIETSNRRKDRSSSRHRNKETSSSEKEMNEKNRSSKNEVIKDKKSELKQDHQSKEKGTIRHSSKENVSTDREMSAKDNSSEKETKKSMEKTSSRRSSKDTESLEKDMMERKRLSEEEAKRHKPLDNKQDHHPKERSSSRHSSKETDSGDKDVNEKKRSSEQDAKRHENLDSKRNHHSKERSSNRYNSKETDSSEKDLNEKKHPSDEEARKSKNLNDEEDHRSKERISSRRASKDTNTCEKDLDKKKVPLGRIKKHKDSEHKLNRSPKKMKHDRDLKNCKTSEELHKRKRQDEKVKTPKRKRRSNSEEKPCDPSKRQKIASDEQISSQKNDRIPLEGSKSNVPESQNDPACDLSTKLNSDEIDSSKLELERLRILRLLEADDDGSEDQNLEANEMTQGSQSVNVKDDNTTPCDLAIKKEKTKINMTEYLQRKKVTLSSKEITNSDNNASDLVQSICDNDGQSEILENGSILKTILLSTEPTIDNIKHMEAAIESHELTQAVQDEVEEGEILDSPKPKMKPDSCQVNTVSGKTIIDTKAKEKSLNKSETEKSKEDIKKTAKKVSKHTEEETKQNLIQQDKHSTNKLKASRNDGKVGKKFCQENSIDMSEQIVIEKESQGGGTKFKKEDNVGHMTKRPSGNDISPIPVVLEESRRRTRTDEKKEHTSKSEKPTSKISKRTQGATKTRQKIQKALDDSQENKIREVVETVPEIKSSSDTNSKVKQEFQIDQKKQSVDEISKIVSNKDAVSDPNKACGQELLSKKKVIPNKKNVEDGALKAPQNSVTVSNLTKKPPPLDIKGVKNIVIVNRNRRRSRVLGNSEDKVLVNKSIEDENTSSPVHNSSNKLNSSNSPLNRSLKTESPVKSPQNLRKLTKLENISPAKAQTSACSKNESSNQKLTSTATEVTVEDKTEVISPNILTNDDRREKRDEVLNKKAAKPVVSSQNSPKCKPVSAKAINIAKPLVGNIIICNRPRRRPQLSDSR